MATCKMKRISSIIAKSLKKNHDFEKNDDALLVFVVLYEIDCYKLLLFGVNNFTI